MLHSSLFLSLFLSQTLSLSLSGVVPECPIFIKMWDIKQLSLSLFFFHSLFLPPSLPLSFSELNLLNSHWMLYIHKNVTLNSPLSLSLILSLILPLFLFLEWVEFSPNALYLHKCDLVKLFSFFLSFFLSFYHCGRTEVGEGRYTRKKF